MLFLRQNFSMRTLMNVSLFFVCFFSTQVLLNAQSQGQITDDMVVRQKEGMLFKAAKVNSPQQEVLDILGWGTPSFAVSNVADGSLESYTHTLRVTYSLQVGGNRTGYQVVFYGLNDKIPYAISQEGNLTSIFMPYQVHDQMKAKVEQALAARRKVQLKLNIMPSGLREATWVLN